MWIMTDRGRLGNNCLLQGVPSSNPKKDDYKQMSEIKVR